MNANANANRGSQGSLAKFCVRDSGQVRQYRYFCVPFWQILTLFVNSELFLSKGSRDERSSSIAEYTVNGDGCTHAVDSFTPYGDGMGCPVKTEGQICIQMCCGFLSQPGWWDDYHFGTATRMRDMRLMIGVEWMDDRLISWMRWTLQQSTCYPSLSCKAYRPRTWLRPWSGTSTIYH